MQSAIVPERPELRAEIADTARPLALTGCRVLALLNGIELFGHEKGNVEVFKALRNAGANVEVGVNMLEDGGDLGAYLRGLDFATFSVPFGCQWSKKFFRRQPTLLAACARDVLRSSHAFLRRYRLFHPTHVHLGNSLAYSYVAPALAASRVPMVFRVGDEPPTGSRPNLWIWKRCLARADVVVANSEFIRRRVLDIRPHASHKLRKIFNFAPLAPVGSNIAQPAADKLRVVFVGQIAEIKGIVPLLDAAISIARQRPDVVFDIVGGSRYSGDLEGTLRAKVGAAGLHGSIHFHGHINEPSAYYAAADLHVAPSICEEAAPNVVLEAKRAGTPSVVFPSGGLPELIRHQVDGFVCREKSVQALTEAILWFLDSPDRLSAASSAALEDHDSRFGPARFIAQWTQAYLSCSRTRRGRTDRIERINA